MMKKDARLIENIRRTLDQSLEDLDAKTCSGLARARHLAIESRQKRVPRLLIWGSIPAAGLVLLVLLLNWPAAPLQPIEPELNDLAIFTADESLEFYQEDIEFYEWLSEVLETDKELSECAAPWIVPVGTSRVGAGRLCSATAEPGLTRLPGVV